MFRKENGWSFICYESPKIDNAMDVRKGIYGRREPEKGRGNVWSNGGSCRPRVTWQCDSPIIGTEDEMAKVTLRPSLPAYPTPAAFNDLPSSHLRHYPKIRKI